jgi:hypothetical protein
MKNAVSPMAAWVIIAVIALVAVIWIIRASDPTQTIVPKMPPAGPITLPASQQHRVPLTSVLPPSQQGRALRINPNYDSPVLEGMSQKALKGQR